MPRNTATSMPRRLREEGGYPLLVPVKSCRIVHLCRRAHPKVGGFRIARGLRGRRSNSTSAAGQLHQRAPADDSRDRRRAVRPAATTALALPIPALAREVAEATATDEVELYARLAGERIPPIIDVTDSAAVLVPASVLAVVVSDVRTGPPIGREVVAILDRHMFVLDDIVVFHVVVGPRPPGPHGD